MDKDKINQLSKSVEELYHETHEIADVMEIVTEKLAASTKALERACDLLAEYIEVSGATSNADDVYDIRSR